MTNNEVKLVGRAVLCRPKAWVDKGRRARSDAPHPNCRLKEGLFFVWMISLVFFWGGCADSGGDARCASLIFHFLCILRPFARPLHDVGWRTGKG